MEDPVLPAWFSAPCRSTAWGVATGGTGRTDLHRVTADGLVTDGAGTGFVVSADVNNEANPSLAAGSGSWGAVYLLGSLFSRTISPK